MIDEDLFPAVLEIALEESIEELLQHRIIHARRPAEMLQVFQLWV